MFEEMPFDIWAIHTNAASYGRRSLHELRIRTLIGAAEMLRNGITTVQDFLTVYPADEAIVDTVLSAYAEAGIRVVFGIAARDRATLDIAPLMTKDLPEEMRRRLVGTSRPAKEELDFVTGQIKRLGMNPRPLTTWALAPSAPQRCSPELLEGLAALSRQHGLPVFTHVYETRPQAAASRVQSTSLLDVLANAGLMNERLNLVHGVWLVRERYRACSRMRARAWCTIRSATSSSRAASRRSSRFIVPASPVALGCDNYSCAETQNIFIAMRMMCLLPAVTDPEPHPITAALCAQGGDADRRQGLRPRRTGWRGEGRDGGGPDDPRSERTGVRPVQQRRTADRFLRSGTGRRNGVRRRPAGGARRQAGHRGRSRARRRSRRASHRGFAGKRQSLPNAAPTSSRRCSKAIAPPGRSNSASSAISAIRRSAERRTSHIGPTRCVVSAQRALSRHCRSDARAPAGDFGTASSSAPWGRAPSDAPGRLGERFACA